MEEIIEIRKDEEIKEIWNLKKKNNLFLEDEIGLSYNQFYKKYKKYVVL